VWKVAFSDGTKFVEQGVWATNFEPYTTTVSTGILTATAIPISSLILLKPATGVSG